MELEYLRPTKNKVSPVPEKEAVADSVLECIGGTPIVRLGRLFDGPVEVLAKLEFLNPGGSLKDRPARFIVEHGLEHKWINRRTHIIESSSGNFGIALAMVARAHRLDFTCVVDPKTSRANLQILRRMGAKVEVVTTPDAYGGYLQTRIERVRDLLDHIPNARWINQYANELSWMAHYSGIGEEVVDQLERPVDVLLAAVSTSATVLGVGRRLRKCWPDVRVIAVDAVGSVALGGAPGPRELPGIGSSRVPELLRTEELDDVVFVSDYDAGRACRELLAAEGIFAGGSSGSVIAALQTLMPGLSVDTRVLALLADRGERYLDLVYDDDWLEERRHASSPRHALPHSAE